jgi:tetratricopeptide (TPR) repeat protein
MSQRLSRKEIKRDEVQEGIFGAVEYVRSHARAILWGVIAVLVAVAVAVGLLQHRAHREERAAEMLAGALRVYRDPVNAAAPQPDDTAAPSFPDEASRDARARELFEEIHDRYGSTDAGAVATAFLGELAARAGEAEEARRLWQAFLDGERRSFLAAEVRLNLFALDRAEGKGEVLIEEIRGLLEQEEAPLPDDVLLHELAVTLERLGREQEATEAYQRLVDEYPRSPYAGPAQQRLGPAAPGLPGAVPGAFPGA